MTNDAKSLTLKCLLLYILEYFLISKSGCVASIPCIDSYIDFLNRSIDSNSTFEFAVPGNEPNLIKLESTIHSINSESIDKL